MVRRYRLVWSRAHDWKSCKPQNGFEGSNLSISAKTKKTCPIGRVFLFSRKGKIWTLEEGSSERPKGEAFGPRSLEQRSLF